MAAKVMTKRERNALENKTKIRRKRHYGGISGLWYFQNCLRKKVEELLLNEINSLPWENVMGRKIQQYGYKYQYDKKCMVSSPNKFPPQLQKLATWIAKNGIVPKDVSFDYIVIEEYNKPSQPSLRTQIHRIDCFEDNILAFNFLSPCQLVFRRADKRTIKKFGGMKSMINRAIPPSEYGTGIVVDILPNTIYVLKEESRFYWSHSIPAYSWKEKRITITFSKVKLQSQQQIEKQLEQAITKTKAMPFWKKMSLWS